MQKELCVLLVEDDPDLREILQENLSELGCKCDTAADGIEALEQLENKAYICVISDIRMPNMDGMQMMEKMKELNINTPVVFMTGFSEYTDERVEKTGGAVLIDKPFNGEKLNEIVQMYIEMLPAA